MEKTSQLATAALTLVFAAAMTAACQAYITSRSTKTLLPSTQQFSSRALTRPAALASRDLIGNSTQKIYK